MRDSRFVAEHRGGPLKREQHLQLMRWACACAEHVLPLCGETPDERLLRALRVAKEWPQGKASVGEARRASVQAIAAASGAPSATAMAVARAVGHAAATAHMADHALGAVLYGLRAARSAGRSAAEEMRWQERQLPSGIRELVLTARERRMGKVLAGLTGAEGHGTGRADR